MVLFGSLLLALFVAEVALRVAAPKRSTFRVWMPNLRHEFYPDATLLPGLPEKARFSVNSLGLRGPELPEKDNSYRIVALGGSTTECLYHDDSTTWTARLMALIGSTPSGKPVWVGNAGRSGMNSGDHVLQTKYLLDDLPKMDMAVLLVGINDLVAALGQPETYKPASINLSPIDNEEAVRRAFWVVPSDVESAWKAKAPFYARLQLYNLVKQLKGNAGKSTFAQDDSGKIVGIWRGYRQKAGHILENLPDLSGPLSVYRQNLLTIADLAAQKSVKLVFLTQPTLWKKDATAEEKALFWMGGVGQFQREPGHDYYSPGALADAMARFNQTLLDVCKERSLDCIDLAEMVPRDTSIFYDDCHFGTRGADLIANRIAEHLKKSL